MPHTYVYNDIGLALGIYNYRLKQVDFDSSFEYFNLNSIVIVKTISVSNNSSVVEDDFKLNQNYQNPFNPSTVISYELQVTSYVTLKVYDIFGKEVVSLINEKQNAGEYSVTFDGADLSDAVYFYRLNSEINGQNNVMTKRMILIK